MEKQKIRTQFQIKDFFLGEETRQFEHEVLDTRFLSEEVERARLSEQMFRQVKAQMQEQAPPGKKEEIIESKPQTQVIAEAPGEESWKERRAKRKQKEKAIQEGKKITSRADELTASVSAQHAEWAKAPAFRYIPERAELVNRPEGEEADRQLEEKKVVLQQHLEVMHRKEITTDLFIGENFVANYRFLRDVIERSQWTAALANNQEFMEKLRKEDLLLYGKVCTWQKTAPLIKEMFELTNAVHGLDLYGGNIPDFRLEKRVTLGTGGLSVAVPDIINHARQHQSEILEEFRQKLEEKKEEAGKEYLEGLQEHFQEGLIQHKAEGISSDTEEQRERKELSDLRDYVGTEEYGVIEKLKTLIEESNEIYLSNEEIVNKMYSDVIRRLEVLKELKWQTDVWGDLVYKYNEYGNLKYRGTEGRRLWKKAGDESTRLMLEAASVAENLSNIKNALTCLLKGSIPNLLEAAVLETYGYHAVADLVNARGLGILAYARGRREQWQNEILERLIQRGDFKPRNRDSQYVSRAVTLFRQGDDAYNLQILNTLQKYEKEESRPRPKRMEGMSHVRMNELEWDDVEQRRPYYDEIRRIVEPQVEQLMAWDMERFLNMNDQQLMEAQIELDQLFGANMFTADLMKMKHPKLDTYTMKEDILKGRLDEFAHRLTILRALVDKSRGLAIKELSYLQPIEDSCFGADLVRGKVGDGSQQARREYARKQIDLGNRQLEAEQRRWEALHDVNSKAFEDACLKKFDQMETLRFLPSRDTQLEQVTKEQQRSMLRLMDGEEGTQEEKDIKLRIYDEPYRVACWDQEDYREWLEERNIDWEELSKQGKNHTMGEPIFRTFSAYLETPGALTQSPEDFRQMLRELSAGARLWRGVSSDEEIFEAREENLRGARRFKESLRVSYDYLGRKYGYGLENLTLMEIYEHWEELLRDFSNTQVDGNFINKVPVTDLNNEDDRRLYHQINYMQQASYSVISLLQAMKNNSINEAKYRMTIEELQAFVRKGGNGSYAAPHKAALKEMGEASGMAATVAWGNAVQIGPRRELPEEDPQDRELRKQQFFQKEEERRIRKEQEETLEVVGRMFREEEERYARSRFEEFANEVELPVELELAYKLRKAWWDTADQGTEKMTFKRKLYTGIRSEVPNLTKQTLRRDLLQTLERFNNIEEYGSAFDPGTGILMNASGTIKLDGLYAVRMAPNMVGVLGGTMTTEDVTQLYEKLLGGGRYRYLRSIKESERTPEENTELEGYTQERVAELDQRFEEGLAQLKQLHKENLYRMRDKYGRYASQLHPEDFLERVGMDFFEETAGLQDFFQIMKVQEENTEEDQELIGICDYFATVTSVLRYHIMTFDMNTQIDEFQPQEIDFYNEALLAMAVEKEHFVSDGPGFSQEEQELYVRQLQETKQGRLFGRFQSSR